MPRLPGPVVASKSWIDFDQADDTPDFDGFELSVGWKF